MIQNSLKCFLNSPPLSFWSLLGKLCTKYIFFSSLFSPLLCLLSRGHSQWKCEKCQAKIRYTIRFTFINHWHFILVYQVNLMLIVNFPYMYRSWSCFVSKVYARFLSVFILHDHLKDFSLRKPNITVIAYLVKCLITPRLFTFESLLH